VSQADAPPARQSEPVVDGDVAHDEGAPARRATPRPYRSAAGPLTFTRLKWASFTHSCIYAALLCAAIAGWATPTLILGWSHGILWIVMSLACIAAVRLSVIPLRVGVAVAVLGGVGPFFGSYEFVREQRRRAAARATGPATGDQLYRAR
jgi:hypothetical protein